MLSDKLIKEDSKPDEPKDQCTQVLNEYLIKNRVIHLSGAVDEKQARDITTRLLAYDWNDRTKDILIYIDSFGGSVDSFIGIHDTIRMLHSDVATICIGKAMSAAAYVLMSGTKGKRFITPNSRICIHEARSTTSGPVSHTTNEISEVRRLQTCIERLLVEYTKIKKDDLGTYMNQNYYMTAKVAKQKGIVDHIIDDPSVLYNAITSA